MICSITFKLTESDILAMAIFHLFVFFMASQQVPDKFITVSIFLSTCAIYHHMYEIK